jgi:hypothetical protein
MRRSSGLPLFICAIGMFLSACSGSTDTQNNLGAGDAAAAPAPAGAAIGAGGAAGKVTPIVTGSIHGAPRASGPVGCPAGKSPSPAQALQAIDQRCLQLRQDGEVWQRTRKLAVLNRGEAGGRMADLHSPWTKENMTFYVDQCGPRQQKSRQASLSRMDQKILAAACI